MSPTRTPLELLQAAAERHTAGDLSAAELLYRAALHREPHPVGQHLLGALLNMTGRHDEAVGFLSKAAAQLPADGELLCNYGAALFSAGRSAEAIPILDRAIATGSTAVVSALVNRSAAHRALGDFKTALADAVEALSLDPNLASGYVNAGSALQALGDRQEALGYFLRGLERSPGDAALECNVGVTLFQLGQTFAARTHLERAVEADPNLADAHHNLGAVRQSLDDFAGADACYRRALEINPNHPGALSNLGSLDLARGRVDGAMASFEAALAIDPQNLEAGSNRLMALNYLPALPPETVATLHRDWGDSLPPASAAPRFTSHGGKLRIGFLSPDLWAHPVASFLEPLLRSVDRERFDLYVYNDRARSDAVTERLRGLQLAWTDVAGLPRSDLVQRIRDDGVDVLIDLAGHTAENRLIALTDRAAPVQMTMIGYPNTTGLPTMDYRVTDAIADPIGEADARHRETLIRIPGGFLCWRPPDEAPSTAPSTGRPLTFGSFNALAKLSAHTISAWATILTAVPETRLLLKSKAFNDPETRSRIMRAFAAHRIASNRLELVAWLPATTDHLGLYSEVDVALDPFPYNGTTTTMEAMWMGVPVISLIGDCHAARVGASLLLHAGVAENLASDMISYVNRAIELGQSSEQRGHYRATLRDQLRDSSLLDGQRYARAMEAAWEQALAERQSSVDR